MFSMVSAEGTTNLLHAMLFLWCCMHELDPAHPNGPSRIPNLWILLVVIRGLASSRQFDTNQAGMKTLLGLIQCPLTALHAR